MEAWTIRAEPSYVWFRLLSVTGATALVTLNVFVTPGAALKFESPGWDARMETVPEDVKVRLVPFN